MDTENGNRSLHKNLKWASMSGFLSPDKLYVRKISKQDCWIMVRKVRLAWKVVSVITKNAVDTFRKLWMQKNCHGKEKAHRKLQTQKWRQGPSVRQSWHTALSSTAEPCPQEASGMLCELWQHFIRVLQKQGLGYNNWDNCTSATLPNVSTWTSAAVSSPNPLPLSVAIEEFPLFYQSLTAPRILDIATILPKDRLLQLPLLRHSASTCLTHYDVHPTSPQFLPISQHLPSPHQQPSWKHHSNSLTSPPLNWLPFHHSAKTGQVQSHPSVLILHVFWTCIQEAKTEQKSKTGGKRMSDLQQQKL